MVSLRTSLVPFFIISLVLHMGLLFFSRPSLPGKGMAVEQIPISLLPEFKEKSAKPSEAVKKAPTRPSRTPAQVARKSTPVPAETGKRTQEFSRQDLSKDERLTGPEPQDRGRYTIVQRPLPTLKELLPPVTWSPSVEQSNNKAGPVRLDTREPKYVSYFTSIKRAIEHVWEYPESALRLGLQGKLVMEFTISGDGHLEGTRLIRSSGFSVLDQEAVRAVQAAAPFHAIPPWIGKSRLEIVASFEYHDNRLKYGYVP
ncbi:MAG: energy transducer TonB [Deltaproteobacteria bacterium]|nr:energy transducer TonB [Deltaproteobacteria bacterium]